MATEVYGGSDKEYELECARLLWDQYKYRHGHCWRVVFQLTTAVVILSVIPYLHKDIVQVLRWGILALPILSIVLAGFSFYLMYHELTALQKIKEKYRQLEANLFKIPHKPQSKFTLMVLIYIVGLGALSVVNLFLVWCIWIPNNLPPY